MSKSHRDNARARKKIGGVAYAKKAARRQAESRCEVCGQKARAKKLSGGICPKCWEKRL